jgi:cysteine desulfurase
MIYLDHAASSPLDPEVLEAMAPFLAGEYANPSGVHGAARRARRALDDAREEFAEVIGCRPGEVIFTSGGTEADNLALRGVRRDGGEAVLVSAIEHHAVLRSGEAIGAHVIPVTRAGLVDLAALAEMCDRPVALVSVMLVNNEVGTRQPLESVVELVGARAPHALVHSDAVQALGWCDVRRALAGVDLASFSAHKFGGPRGIGALMVRHRGRARLSPILLGGAQEADLRPGTENVAGAVGMAKAARLSDARREAETLRVGQLKDQLIDTIRAGARAVIETVGRADAIAPIAHLLFPGVEAEELLFLLDRAEIAASSGAACAAGAIEPSHVLAAMGLSPAECSSAIRFSLGTSTESEEIATAAAAILSALGQLGQDRARVRQD